MPHPEQTNSNHARLDPAFHFVLLPLLLFVVLAAIINLILRPGLVGIILLAIAAVMTIAATLTRVYALRVQDRLIRLEERLRMTMLLPTALQSRIPEFSERQLIALRFACDAELPALSERTLNEKLTPKQIKQAIQRWRPDYFRV